MKKANNNSQHIRRGVAVILVLLIAFGGVMTVLAAPKHDNFNERANERANERGIQQSNPNSALREKESGSGDENISSDDTSNGDNNSSGSQDSQGSEGSSGQENQQSGDDGESDDSQQQENNNLDNSQQPADNNDENTSPEENNEVSTSVSNQESSSNEEAFVILEDAEQAVPLGAVDTEKISEVPFEALVIVLDEEAPQSAPMLPRTGDGNSLINYLTGLLLTAAGLLMKKKAVA